MSISPTNNLSSNQSSNYSHQNPNSNHGLSKSPQNHQNPIPIPPPNNDNQSRTQISDASPDFSATASDSTTASSKKMNDMSKSSGKNFLKYRSGDSQRGGGVMQYREKTRSETVVSPHHTQQSSPGPSNCKPSTTQGSGRKNQMVNANHLLNFHYNPISLPKSRAPHPPPQRRHQKRKPYNKDLFLQANYRFVLLDSGAHSPETLDPDKMLIWEDIVCVKFSTPFPVTCPICLDDPFCPQITSCGHIFCFPCILRYFLNSEDDHKGEIWKKCPLCFVMISSKDLYTIYIEYVKQHSVGDTAEFMLLTRQKDSCVLSPKQNESVGTENKAPDSFSKFIFTSDADMAVRDSVSELDSWLARADSGLVDDLEKLPYVCAAMEQLEQRRKYWNERRSDHENVGHKCNRSRSEVRGSPPTANYVEAHSKHGKSVLEGTFSGNGNAKLKMVVGETLLDHSVDVLESSESEKGVLSSLHGENTVMQTNFNGSGGGKEKDSYNFYQAVDGQHLILHPLNLRCLLHHYGSYDMLPHRISGKILQLETLTQSETMRRRYRFLSHFSLTTTFQLCEIDLAGCLPPGALSPFMDEINNRENQRKRLAKKERQEKIKADAAADAALANDMLATLPFNNIPFSSQGSAPTFSLDDFAALGGGSAAMSSSPPLTTGTGGGKMQFANVARLGFAAAHDSPALRTEASTPLNSKSEPATKNYSGVTLGGVVKNDGGTPSFAHVISRTKDDNNQKEVEAPKTNDTTKKGKKASRVLLSTSGGRRY